MNTERKIQGYLECDGSIVKISSLDDVKAFVLKYGKSMNEITEAELDELTREKKSYVDVDWKETEEDDCGVVYYKNHHVLSNFGNTHVGDYKVLDGTIAIGYCASYSGYRNIISSIFCPNTLLVIGDRAFFDCKDLTNIKFSDSLIKIGSDAFYGCGISEVVIPEKVKIIGSSAFNNCKNLSSVTFKGKPEKIGSGIFSECKNLAEIRIPAGSLEYFKEALFVTKEVRFVEE